MGFLGLFVATIGQDGIHAHDRFTFGCATSPAAFADPGAGRRFGFAEVLTAMKEEAAPA